MNGLLGVLKRARAHLARADNDFSWSGWADQSAALAEMDGIISELKSGTLSDPQALTMLFLPTGPLQEVSVSCGWSIEFLDLANTFDAEMLRAGY
jgi:hypothetical protein